MITVRNNSKAPIDVGALLAPGESGRVSPDRPGVRKLVELGYLVVVEGDVDKVDLSAELAAVRTENADLKRANETLTSDVARLTAIVESLSNAASKPVEAESKPPKKGG